MYALPNKTQHKLIAKVRGGISQLDNITSPSSSNNSGPSSFNTSSSSPFKTPQSLRDFAFCKNIDDAGFNAELGHLPQPIFHSIPEKNGNKSKSSSHHQRAHRQFITPEHNEMIKYVQQSWKGVERDYKKSVNNVMNHIDINNSSDHHATAHMKQKSQQQANAKKKAITTSTPLLLSGSYHHTSITKDSTSSRQDSFQPFDLEAFWGNRILKRLTEEL